RNQPISSWSGQCEGVIIHCEVKGTMAITKEQHDELAVSYAALVLFDGDAEITSEALSNVITASGNEVEPYWPTLFAGLLSKEGKLLELITSGGGIGGAAAAPAAGAAAGGAAAKEEKKEEKKEEEDADLGGGMDMFGGSSDY
ncbi:hypothetical protein H257_10853, partial [Aphanomyces astaci]